ncbi:MAG TPA: SusC/RagA family TonB-linked outer membrane protein, partial [Bacteroidales bacterium]
MDASTNEPLIGVNVSLEGTTVGTITDVAGNYSLVPPGSSATLVFTYIGYVTQKVQFSGQNTIDVKMTSEVLALEEVVVVGYGTARKSDISGSVASVSSKDMLKVAPTNILQGLKGLAAGVVISARDGAPDGNSTIRIRGVATINGTTNPLYVVDGVQVGTNVNFLNPSDVANIEILKDASATAIYGSAGANGVIMITTKRGTQGPSHISLSADFGIQTLAQTLDICSVDQYAANIRQARANDGGILANQVWAAKYDGQRQNIDWQKALTRVSQKQQYNLSATGGTETTQSSLSLGYLNNDGIVINTNYKRLTGRANITTKVADFLEIGTDLNFVHSESNGSNAQLGNNGNLSSLADMAFVCPTMDYVDPISNQLVT